MGTIKIYNYKNYRTFLTNSLDEMGRGSKQELANRMNCKSSFVTQLLNGTQHLSLEQAEAAAPLFKLSDLELRYFLLLIQMERAGTPSLKKIFEDELNKLKHVDTSIYISKDVNSIEINPQYVIDYFSKWYVSVIHLLTESSKYRYPEILARSLGLSENQVLQALELLMKMGYVVKKGEKYFGKEGVHVKGPSSAIVKRFIQLEWQQKTISRALNQEPFDMANSTVMVCSSEHAESVKRDLVKVIAKHSKTVGTVSPDGAYFLAVYMYPLTKNN